MKRRTGQRNRREECDETDEAERLLFRALTPEQWRKHKAFTKRRDEFYALPWSEKVDMARAVLAMDPDLAEQVMHGTIPLFEAHRTKGSCGPVERGEGWRVARQQISQRGVMNT
jgi:hypothetical protein